jgi:hypothetical protein
MKKFNKVIQVEVSVDTIAEKLLETMAPDFKHREQVVEAIIGAMVEHEELHKIAPLYNALNGFSNDINFKAGDKVKLNKDGIRNNMQCHHDEKSYCDTNDVFTVTEVFNFAKEINLTVEGAPKTYLYERRSIKYFDLIPTE